MADYLTDMARHERKRRAMEQPRQATDRRAIMDRLPPAMLTDLNEIKAAFGPLAIRWIEIDGETLHGREPDWSRRVVPVKQHPAAGGKA